MAAASASDGARQPTAPGWSAGSAGPAGAGLASLGGPPTRQTRAGAARARLGPLALVGAYVVTALVLVVVTFFLPRALPGQPLATLDDPQSPAYIGDDQRRQTVEAYYGLDQPLAEQFQRYVTGLATGDLGTSISQNVAVSRLLAQRLPWTLLLGGTALALATAAGMAAGIHSGWRRGRAADRRLLVGFITLDNVPVFFLASAAAYALAVRLGWFPLAGARTAFSGSWSPLAQAVDIAHHLVLPATVLAAQFAAFQYLVMRASMVGELGSSYLALGRAKGLAERTLKYRYAARNALLPTVSVLALQTGVVITGSIFVEAVFAYPGLGRLMFEAVGNRDYPTLQGVFLVFAAIVLTANLAADLAYRRLDPRVSR